MDRADPRTGPDDGALATPHLELPAFDLATLSALYDDRRNAAARLLRARLPLGWSIAGEDWLALRITQVELDPHLAPWLLRAIVRRADRQLLGTVGFHGPPGSHPLEAEWPGVVEFGYSVAEGFRRNGYATEAARGLMEWGREHGALTFVLSIRAANRASRRVAEKLGAAAYGEDWSWD